VTGDLEGDFMVQIVVFEDPLVSQLNPITLGRAAYSVQCGSICLGDWLLKQNVPLSGQVRPYLDAWQQAEFPPLANAPTETGDRLLINARVVPSESTFGTIQQLIGSRRPGLIFQGESLAVACLPRNTPPLANPYDPNEMAAFLQHPEIRTLPVFEEPVRLLGNPSDLIREHLNGFTKSLESRIREEDLHEVRDGVFAASNSEIAEWVDLDTQQGPIVLSAGAAVKPFACLRGPTYLGAFSRVNEHAVLRPGVSVGTMSKVGGEIEASVIEAFSNKQHNGYLGHSYLGRWVNLGAGTATSNLKNTYGNVRIESNGRRIDTGMQFMGCVVGDYTKTAVNTSVFTGKLLGCCSMVYGFVTTNVPSFVNYARSFGEITELPAEVVTQTQKRTFQRRGIEQLDWHKRLIQDMYQIAADGRQLADRPVSL
jgi:glucose-1-phosphate thymidylyltransferase